MCEEAKVVAFCCGLGLEFRHQSRLDSKTSRIPAGFVFCASGCFVLFLTL
jgi:hypothetical protein